MASWIPMPEVAERTEGVITVGYIGMPEGMDPASLELNVGALNRGVIGWGGYSAMTLAAYAGDRDQIGYSGTPHESGTGYATGAAVVSKAETHDYQSTSDVELNASDVRSGTLGVQWNINALNDKVELHEQFDPAIRARQLDTEIRKAAIRGIWRHNVTEKYQDIKYSSLSFSFPRLRVTCDGFFLASIVTNLSLGNHAGAANTLAWRLGGAAFINLLPSLREAKLYGGGFKDMLPEFFFFSSRPDRAAIGTGVLATSRLVRASR